MKSSGAVAVPAKTQGCSCTTGVGIHRCQRWAVVRVGRTFYCTQHAKLRGIIRPGGRSNPAGWRQEESRAAVAQALRTRRPEDVQRARVLQERNTRKRERSPIPNPGGLTAAEVDALPIGATITNGGLTATRIEHARWLVTFANGHTATFHHSRIRPSRGDLPWRRTNPARVALPIGSGIIANPAKKRTYKRKKAMQVQDLLFDVNHWTLARAKSWAKKNGHKCGAVSQSEHFIHLRQYSPSDYQKGTLHNIALAKNVEAIVGVPKSHTDAGTAAGYNTRGPQQHLSFPSARSVVEGNADDVIW